MSSGSYRLGVTWFVNTATEIANPLDFAVEMPCPEFKIGSLLRLKRQWLDLSAEASQLGDLPPVRYQFLS